jgi:adenylylsulfate kinase
VSHPSGAVVWLTGPPSSGKTTIGRELVERLRAAGAPTCLLDGDEVRERLHPRPAYDEEARAGFYATLADLAALLESQGLVVVVAATAHRREYRDRARRVAGRFIEAHVRCDLDTCAARDPKGLYARARAGELDLLPGVSVPYEEPPAAEVTVEGKAPVAAAAGEIAAAIRELGVRGVSC